MGGGGGASKPVKTAGDITAARDYPPQGRADRAGKRVIIVLRVGTDGHPTGCRIHAPSGNDEADAITCRLALQRFRFRPALDRDGNPVAADYGWEQRWWAP
jgi:protein TonB